MKLARQFVEKPWGRTELPQPFPSTGAKIGEVWFTAPEPAPLLAKYLFTSERLSIQVHPADAEAKARGLSNGKTECWYILDADPGAVLGLGLTRKVSKSELRSAALDGTIESLMHWRPASAGDFLFVPAGTIHAVGAGIALLEFQQNDGVTYRLYDYGRPRELHLDDAVAVARAEPYPDALAKTVDAHASQQLEDGEHFRLAHVVATDAAKTFAEVRRWVMPLEGKAIAAGAEAGPGECLLIEPGVKLEATGRLLIGAEPQACRTASAIGPSCPARAPSAGSRT